MKSDTCPKNLNDHLLACGKNRILLVAAGPCAFKDPCRKALIKLGFEITDFDYRSSIYFHSKTMRRISRKLPFIKRVVNKNTNRRFKRAIDISQPDALFCLKADTIYPETVQYARKKGIITINWYPDFIWDWDTIQKLVPVYDFFFSQDSYVLRLLKERGFNNCHYLPSAADLNENNPDPFINRTDNYNIAMIATYSGSVYSERAKYIEAVKDLGLNIWGPPSWLGSPLKHYYRGTITPDKVFDIYRETKIVPNIHYSKEIAEGISLRPFETMGSGAMLISDDVRSDIFNLFKDGEEFVSFPDGDANDFRKKVKYYLEHEDERLRIAKNGYKKIIAKHTYNTRMKEMIDVVSRKKV